MRYGYFLGIGSNINPARHMARAIECILALTHRIDVSRVVQTRPVDLQTASQFLNAVAYLETDLTREALKSELNRIEIELGRDRADPHRGTKDRTIDLDILLQIPAQCRTVAAVQLAEEPYHRPLLIELLHVLGFACPLQAGAVTGASSIECAGVMAGLVPFRLERGQTTTNPTLRHHRAALVTGAGVRLGRAIADSLARAGYDIALHYNGSHAAATEAANEFRSYGVRCELFRYDLANAHDIGDLVARVAERLPHLSVLVNSASAYQGGRIADTSVETLNRQWDINFRAPFFLMQQFHQRVEHGQIINIVDNKIAYNQFHYVAYLSAKKALAELTKMAALEFAPRIRVNAVAPGVVLPASDRGEAYLEWRKAAIPVDRLGAPNNICAAIAAILENDFINGQIIFVDGGEAMNLVGRNALEFGNVSRT